MHKSILTFGLLMSSLVMLSAITLFNINNSAMAQEYDKYEDSSYIQYPNDDKKYECRTGPFEGFFVRSVELCKHVKFGDNNDVRDGNGVGRYVCNPEAVKACFQQNIDEFRFEELKGIFEEGSEIPVIVFGAGELHGVLIGSFEDICVIPTTIPTTDDELGFSLLNILETLPVFDSFDPSTDPEFFPLLVYL